MSGGSGMAVFQAPAIRQNGKVPWALLAGSEIYVDDAAYGAKGDLKIVTDGAMTSGSTTLTSATAGWTTADEGKQVQVHNAGASGNALKGTIVTRLSSTQVTLSVANASGVGLTNVRVIWGTDDSARFAAAEADAGALAAASGTRATVVSGPKAYYVGGVTFSHDNVTLRAVGGRLFKFGNGPMFTVNANGITLRDLWLDGNANSLTNPTYTGNVISAPLAQDMVIDNCVVENGDWNNGAVASGYCVQITGVTYTRYIIRNSKFQLFGQPVKPAIAGPGTVGQLTVPTALTATAPLTAGSLGSGVYRYVPTFKNANGETSAGAETTVTTDGTHQQVSLTNIPTGPAGTVSRGIYRTSVGGAAGTNKLVAVIADNTTTTYTDNTADASLGVQVPANNSTGLKEVGGSSKIINNEFEGGDAVDFSGMVSCTFMGNMCRSCSFNDNTLVIRAVGNRVFGDWTIYGQSVMFTNNAHGGTSLVLGLGANLCIVENNFLTSGLSIVDNSQQTNSAHRNSYRATSIFQFWQQGLRIGLSATDVLDSTSRLEMKSQGSSTDAIKVYNSNNTNLMFRVREGSGNQGAAAVFDSSGNQYAEMGNSGFRLGTSADVTYDRAATATGVLKSTTTERFRWGSTGLSFNGASEKAKPTFAAAATDLASAITLANDLRTQLIGYGLGA